MIYEPRYSLAEIISTAQVNWCWKQAEADRIENGNWYALDYNSHGPSYDYFVAKATPEQIEIYNAFNKVIGAVKDMNLMFKEVK